MPSSKSTGPLVQFHRFAGHPGLLAACEVCAKQLRSQRRLDSALRSQRRQTSQEIDAILRKAAR